MPEESKELHILGKISGYYGVKGWVKIYSYTQPRENIVCYEALKVKLHNHSASEWQDIQLDNGKVHGKGVVAHFVGYDNRDTAARLIGAELAVYRSEFKPTVKDEYYWTDLIELMVINLEGVQLGRVERLIETAANDVIVVKPTQLDTNKVNTSNQIEVLIPFVLDYYVKKVDLEAGKILVDWPVAWNEGNENK